MFIGIMIMVILMVVVLMLANKEKWPKAEKRPTMKELGETFVRAIPAILLPVIILGGIYSGLLHPYGISSCGGCLGIDCGNFHL